ncbi:MAG: hypothetical protein LCH67_07710 [Bacteroidetes bacterium]|nr:hypothetical protein [Bacteroidota bacterium]
METLMVKGGSKTELRFFKSLAQKMGLKAKLMTFSEMEDVALANAMEKGRTGVFVDPNEFLENLIPNESKD